MNPNLSVTSSFFATNPKSNSVVVSQRGFINTSNVIFSSCLSWQQSRHTLSFGLGVHAFVFNSRTEPAALSYTVRAAVSRSIKVPLIFFGVRPCERWRSDGFFPQHTVADILVLK